MVTPYLAGCLAGGFNSFKSHACYGLKFLRDDGLSIPLIVLLLLFGGGGGLYWGIGTGRGGIGPIGLIIVALVVAFLVYGYRGRRGSRL